MILLGTGFSLGNRPQSKHQDQADNRHADQFEETPAGVFRVGVTFRCYIGMRSKEICELNHNKRYEQQVHEEKDHCRRDPAHEWLKPFLAGSGISSCRL